MKIVSSGGITDRLRAIVTQDNPGVEIFAPPNLWQGEGGPDPGLRALLADCEVLMSSPFAGDLIAHAPRLKWLHTISAGAEPIIEACERFGRRDVIVTNSSGAHAKRMGEYIAGMIIAHSQQFPFSMRAMARHEWVNRRHYFHHIRRLQDAVVGMVGYGSIAREAARLVAPMGLQVYALKYNPAIHADPGWAPPGIGDPEGRIPSRWFGPTQLNEMLAASDYVAVSLPLTPATQRFMGATAFEAIKPGAFVINVGRGGLIDQDAMIETLRSGKLSGAGLDVTVPEPLNPESPLWDMENVVITPHIAGFDRWSTDNAWVLFAENLKRYRTNQPLLNQVDFARGY